MAHDKIFLQVSFTLNSLHDESEDERVQFRWRFCVEFWHLICNLIYWAFFLILLASDEHQHQQHEPQPVTTDNTSLLCSPSQQQKTCSDPLMKGTVSNTEAMNSAIGAISDKILWASNALKSSCSTEESIRLCELLKVCAETLKVLQDLQK